MHLQPIKATTFPPSSSLFFQPANSSSAPAKQTLYEPVAKLPFKHGAPFDVSRGLLYSCLGRGSRKRLVLYLKIDFLYQEFLNRHIFEENRPLLTLRTSRSYMLPFIDSQFSLLIRHVSVEQQHARGGFHQQRKLCFPFIIALFFVHCPRFQNTQLPCFSTKITLPGRQSIVTQHCHPSLI